MGIQDVSNIPNRIESFSITDLLTLTEQEKEYIQNSFIKVIYSQIPKSKYYNSKGVTIEIDNKTIKTNSYGINLTNEEYKNLVIAILNEVSQDQTILNILLQKIMLIDSKTDVTIDTLRTSIQEQITKINTNGFSNGIKIQVYEANEKVVRTQVETSEIDYYIFDHERIGNSIRTLVSLNYTYTKIDENQEQQTQNNVTFTNDDYQIIEGSASGEPQEVIPKTTTYTIKSIEFAKQISGTQNNMIGIVTFDKDNETIKVSLQNKTEEDSKQNGFINNIILNINNSDTTYFKITASSNIMPNSNITVQELNETNSAILNNRTAENISQLLTAIKAQLKKIYEQQMQVAKEVQEQEDAKGLTHIDPGAAETNTIIDRNDVVNNIM